MKDNSSMWDAITWIAFFVFLAVVIRGCQQVSIEHDKAFWGQGNGGISD